MKILVTGGTGFIGSHAVHVLSGQFKVLAPSSAELDLLNEMAVHTYLRRHMPDVVLHAATWNATRTSPKDPTRVLENNLAMHFNLVRASSCFGKLIHYGSGAEFDHRHWHREMVETEFGLHAPSDAYGFSKYLIEGLSVRFRNVVNLRLFGVYGPGEDWRIRFISNACCYALHGQPILLHQDRVFDYTWIDDVIQVTKHFIETDGELRTVNVCSADPLALSRIAELVLGAADRRLPIIVETAEMGLGYSGSNRLLREAMPDFTFTPIQEGIQRMFRYYESIRDLIDLRQIR